MTQRSSWLEEVWEEREEKLYPGMFGPMRGIFPIPPARFQRFDAPPDPRWLMTGVFECAPTATRSSWVYVTSGLSNPWDDEANPNEPTGYACEFAIETARQGDWAIPLLHHLASIHLLACSRRIHGKPFGHGDRVALHGGIDEGASALRHVLITDPVSFDKLLLQRSGFADWLFCVGISDAEKAFARESGNDLLLERLAQAAAFPVTDPDRKSLQV
jgi:hypothetical protein